MDSAVKHERTESQILAQEPIKVRLGEKDYDVPLLRILAARAWRKKLVEEVTAVSDVVKPDASTTPAFLNGLAFLFLQFPEKLADLVFGYAPSLPREEIEENATEEQLAKAFGQIVEVAFPFVGELKAVTQTLSLAANFPPTGSASRLH